MSRPVRLPAGWTTLAQALAEASRQSGVPVSYSSTRIAGTRRLYVSPGPAQPLGSVLSDLLGPRRVAFGLLNGQVVLWPAQLASPLGVTHINERGQLAATGLAKAPATPPKPKQTRVVEATPVGKVVPAATLAAQPVGKLQAAKNRVASTQKLGQPRANPKNLVTKARPLNGIGGNPPAALSQPGHLAGRDTAVAMLAGRVVPVATLRLSALPVVLPLTASPALVPAVPNNYRSWQLGLVYPLSTNGRANARLTNGVSVNGLVGYAAGVRQVEVGGLANLVRDTVRGVQVAGVLNLTGAAVHGVQVAYYGANWSGGSLRGVQGALLLNAVRDNAHGLQVATFNVAGGKGSAGSPTRLRRWLAGPRYLATDSAVRAGGPGTANQPSGFLLQVASVANLAGQEMRGVQASNLLNVANRITGVQFGLVNIAHHVRGLQFGAINIADSVSGVSVGLINLVRHGYNHGEVWVSESMPLNVALKLGVRRYYTILSAAANPVDDRLQWAAGFGVGTAGRPHGRWTLSLDVITWNIFSNPADDVFIQLLTQLRPTAAWQIEKAGRLQLLLVPTLNWGAALGYESEPPQAWRFGRDRWLLINQTNGAWATRVWPGFQVGLRF